MGKAKKSPERNPGRPATTPEARENQLIALAVDLAEKQLLEGTASAQVICHYLKLGSTRGRIENKMLSNKADLISAQIDNLNEAKKVEDLYEEAIAAMRRYGGAATGNDEAEH